MSNKISMPNAYHHNITMKHSTLRTLANTNAPPSSRAALCLLALACLTAIGARAQGTGLDAVPYVPPKPQPSKPVVVVQPAETPAEKKARLAREQAARDEATRAKQQAQDAKQRAKEETQRADSEKRRADEAQAKLAQLERELKAKEQGAREVKRVQTPDMPSPSVQTFVFGSAAAIPSANSPYVAGQRLAAYSGQGAPVLVSLPMAQGTEAGTLLGGVQYDNEKPAYRVKVPYKLAMGETEVTFEQWGQCVADGGCTHTPDDAGWGKADRPVMRVSFNDIQEYLKWANKKAGLDPNESNPNRLRLPTEAEWEYAARAGSDGDYSLGANNSAELTTAKANYDNKLQKTVAVKSYEANKWGLFDMHGNVWEWTQDCYNGKEYEERAKAQPWDARQMSAGSDNSGNACRRVLRGGSWFSSASDLRSACRNGSSPSFRGNNSGLRLARTLP